jgi:radical SAM superfamily enzyme YgiQ (UPF0313 family)
MFGLPGETEKDLTAIGEFLKRLSNQSSLKLHVSINPFIPKPFSMGEKFAMLNEQLLQQKKEIILKNIPGRRNIKVSISDIKRSILESIISRADRNFSSVLYNAFYNGSQFDGHREKFSWHIWEKAMEENGVDYRFYLDAETENFPWSFIDNNGKS